MFTKEFKQLYVVSNLFFQFHLDIVSLKFEHWFNRQMWSSPTQSNEFEGRIELNPSSVCVCTCVCLWCILIVEHRGRRANCVGIREGF